MKKITVVLMALIMALAMTACGGGENGNTGGDAAMTVKIEIDYPDESGIADVEDATVEVPEGASVLDALNAYAEANDCDVVMDENSDTPYVISIGGREAADSAGWIYELNDEMVMESADVCVLKAGDKISWSYETWGE